jgi:hypothetical protein
MQLESICLRDKGGGGDLLSIVGVCRDIMPATAPEGLSLSTRLRTE